MRRNIYTSNKAFSLLEVTVVIIIITILASSAIPVLSRSYIEKAGNKTALDISAIQDAARAYYIDHNSWPDSSVYPNPITALQVGNYLPSSWSAVNPFGISASNPSNYSYIVTSRGPTLTVDTFVPIAAQPIIENLLPTNWVSGNTIYSTISVPGESSVLPAGIILPWASNNLPAGFLWCNGQTVIIEKYSALYAVLGTTYGGDGIITFGLPNFMARTIVGVDGMGGVTPTNLITQWSSAPATMGGTFGESTHRQSVIEMAPHTHGSMLLQYPGDNSHGLPGGLGTGYGNSGSAGGVGDGSGLGAPANVVQASIALGYIIKY